MKARRNLIPLDLVWPGLFPEGNLADVLLATNRPDGVGGTATRDVGWALLATVVSFFWRSASSGGDACFSSWLRGPGVVELWLAAPFSADSPASLVSLAGQDSDVSGDFEALDCVRRRFFWLS